MVVKKIHGLILVCLCLFFGRLYANENIIVVDDLNRTITLKNHSQRIIALAPHIVENLYAAGAGNKIVGVVEHSDYPEQAKNIVNIGRVNNISVESIIDLEPDLIIVWAAGNGVKVLSKLEALGFTVYASNPKKLNDIPLSIRHFGILAGTQNQAEKTALKFEKKYAHLKARYTHAKPVSVMYQIWSDPILSVNKEQIISHVIDLCGGENVFKDAKTLVPKLNVESVILKDPSVIVTSSNNKTKSASLEKWKKYTSLQAVKNNHLYYIPADLISRHGPRIIEGAQIMCDHIQKAR